MPIKNIISDRGFKYAVTDRTGPCELQIRNVVITEPFVYEFKKNEVMIQAPFNAFSSRITASLPKITLPTVGQNFILAITASSGDMLLSASDPINNGLWTRTISSKNMIWCFSSIISVGNFSWIIASSSLF